MIPAKLIDGVLAELRSRGIRIVYDGDDKMHLAGETAGIEKDEKVMAALKAFRPHILERIKQTFRDGDPEPEDEPDPTQAPARPEWETCRVCRAVVHQTMTADDATILCDKVGARERVSTSGFKVTPEALRCPYRPPSASGGR